MNWINDFTVLIQTISAVNFAYIATHFPTKVFDLLFNKAALLKQGFSDRSDETAADIESLKAMDPIKTSDGLTNEAMLNELRGDYSAFKTKWEEQKKNAEDYIDQTKDVKGFKSLFLFVSLYCFLILLFIAMMTVHDSEYLLMLTIILNIVFAISLIFFSVIVWTNKWDKHSEVECYKKTSLWFIIALSATFVFSLINALIVSSGSSSPIHSLTADVILSLSVIIPFYPCILTIVFILIRERRIKSMIGNDNSTLIKEQKELHERKEKLEETYNSFKPEVFVLK